MKKFFFFSLLIGGLMSVYSCHIDDVFPDDGFPDIHPDLHFNPCEHTGPVAFELIPDTILQFLASQYPGFFLETAEEYPGIDSLRFGISINHGGEDIELLFDADGVLLSFGSDSTRFIPVDSLPSAILDYLAIHFPGVSIQETRLEVEFGMGFYRVRLADNTQVYFTLEGTFSCEEVHSGDDDDDGDHDGDDHDGDCDEHHSGDLPASITDFLQANYPDYQIRDIDCEKLCDSTRVWEIELKKPDEPGLDLYFSAEGDFLFAAVELPYAGLPQAVKAAVSAEFPGLEPDDDVEEWQFPDGMRRYLIELEESDHDDDSLKALFSADGALLCVIEDD